MFRRNTRAVFRLILISRHPAAKQWKSTLVSSILYYQWHKI